MHAHKDHCEHTITDVPADAQPRRRFRHISLGGRQLALMTICEMFVPTQHRTNSGRLYESIAAEALALHRRVARR